MAMELIRCSCACIYAYAYAGTGPVVRPNSLSFNIDFLVGR